MPTFFPRKKAFDTIPTFETALVGKTETEDQLMVAEYLGILPYIDKNRIGIFGWSYGGFLAANCLLEGNDIFKVGIAAAPVSNWNLYSL